MVELLFLLGGFHWFNSHLTSPVFLFCGKVSGICEIADRTGDLLKRSGPATFPPKLAVRLLGRKEAGNLFWNAKTNARRQAGDILLEQYSGLSPDNKRR
jgi:hypothetical protein